MSTLRVLPRLFIGGIEKVRGFSIQQIERARVESDAPITFHVDGEPVEGGKLLEARVLPGALMVCAGMTDLDRDKPRPSISTRPRSGAATLTSLP